MMRISIGRLLAMLLLGGALAGCVDADVDVAITSPTTARATTTQVMGAEFYTMLKLSAERAAETKTQADETQAGESLESDAPEGGFCEEGRLTGNPDGTATCIILEHGAFATLNLTKADPRLVFAAAGPGLVRISLLTADLQTVVGADEAIDDETRSMMEAFFKGRALTLRFSGAAVTETNMTLSEDETSAEIVIGFLALLAGTAELPDELFAVVRAP